MVEIMNLTKKFKGKKALDDVSLTIGNGEIIGIFGENGAGKTTLMKCTLDLYSHDGTVLLDGEKVTRKNIHKMAFATCEHSFFPNISADAHRDFYKDHFDNFKEKRYEGMMNFFNLPRKKPIRTFSTGQQNQFEVIMALCQGADYIFMDEPFSGNDLFNREDFYKLLLGILEDNETIILSTHLIEEVSDFVGRAILIHEGKVIADQQVDELQERGESLVDFVKTTFSYEADRVGKALAEITGEEA